MLGVAATLTAMPAGPAPGGARAAGWTGLLDQAHDLGPSRAATAEVLVALRAPRRPASLLGWAARHGLRATWFRGQPTVLLAARPAVLGRALGVRIDDFRLPGYRVFYASRGGGHVPAPLDAEVATVSRITSFGQVQSVGDPSGPATGDPSGPATGGLAPGGFLSAYDVRPLWQHGDLGQGETIVFFEVDGYHPADLAAYAARFGLPRVADPLPHIGPLNAKVLGESDMDLEVAHAIAPDATLVYVNLGAFGGKNSSPAAQFLQAFSTVAREYPGAIWSASLGQCEDIFSRTDAAAVNNAAGWPSRLARRPLSPAGIPAGSSASACTPAIPGSRPRASPSPGTSRR
jgi:kumamolisin